MRVFACVFSLFFSVTLLGKITSLDLCADQWVLWLFEAKDITAISPLSTDTKMSFEHKKAENIPRHTNKIEDFLAHPEDIYIATYIPHYKKKLMEKAGLQIILLPNIKNVGDFEKIFKIFEEGFLSHTEIRDKIEKARYLLKNSKKNLSKKALTFDVGGYSCGSNTNWSVLFDQAGLENINTKQGCHYTTIENVLIEIPDYIFCTGDSPNLPSCTHNIFKDQHPCVLSESLILCTTPHILLAALEEVEACNA